MASRLDEALAIVNVPEDGDAYILTCKQAAEGMDAQGLERALSEMRQLANMAKFEESIQDLKQEQAELDSLKGLVKRLAKGAVEKADQRNNLEVKILRKLRFIVLRQQLRSLQGPAPAEQPVQDADNTLSRSLQATAPQYQAAASRLLQGITQQQWPVQIPTLKKSQPHGSAPQQGAQGVGLAPQKCQTCNNSAVLPQGVFNNRAVCNTCNNKRSGSTAVRPQATGAAEAAGHAALTRNGQLQTLHFMTSQAHVSQARQAVASTTTAQGGAAGRGRGRARGRGPGAREPGGRGAGRGAKAQQPKEGAKDQPIELLSSEDEGDGRRGDQAGPGPGSTAMAAADAAKAAGITTRGSERLKLQQDILDSHVFKGLSMRFPLHDDKAAVEVHASDLDRLGDEEFLNDTVIDFYLRYIECHLPPDVRDRCYFFNSFFYKKLTEKVTKPRKSGAAGRGQCEDNPLTIDDSPSHSKQVKGKLDHDRVRKWTKHVDLFSKDFVFVPIHEALHWSLAIICHPRNWHYPYQPGLSRPEGEGEACILHLDSMDGGHHPGSVFKALRSYLFYEWQRKADESHDNVAHTFKQQHPDVVPEVSPDCWPSESVTTLPRQDNHCDCGLYLLCYVEFFCWAAGQQLLIRRGAISKAQRKNPRRSAPTTPAAAALLAAEQPRLLADYPEFLTPNWFRQDNASGLRQHLRYLIFKLMLEQARPDVGEQLLGKLRENIDKYEEDAKRNISGKCYLRPELYISMAAVEKAEREQAQADALAAQAAARAAEAEEAAELEAELKRGRSQAAAAHALQTPADSDDDLPPRTKTKKRGRTLKDTGMVEDSPGPSKPQGHRMFGRRQGAPPRGHAPAGGQKEQVELEDSDADVVEATEEEQSELEIVHDADEFELLPARVAPAPGTEPAPQQPQRGSKRQLELDLEGPYPNAPVRKHKASTGGAAAPEPSILISGSNSDSGGSSDNSGSRGGQVVDAGRTHHQQHTAQGEVIGVSDDEGVSPEAHDDGHVPVGGGDGVVSEYVTAQEQQEGGGGGGAADGTVVEGPDFVEEAARAGVQTAWEQLDEEGDPVEDGSQDHLGSESDPEGHDQAPKGKRDGWLHGHGNGGYPITHDLFSGPVRGGHMVQPISQAHAALALAQQEAQAQGMSQGEEQEQEQAEDGGGGYKPRSSRKRKKQAAPERSRHGQGPLPLVQGSQQQHQVLGGPELHQAGLPHRPGNLQQGAQLGPASEAAFQRGAISAQAALARKGLPHRLNSAATAGHQARRPTLTISPAHVSASMAHDEGAGSGLYSWRPPAQDHRNQRHVPSPQHHTAAGLEPTGVQYGSPAVLLHRSPRGMATAAATTLGTPFKELAEGAGVPAQGQAGAHTSHPLRTFDPPSRRSPMQQLNPAKPPAEVIDITESDQEEEEEQQQQQQRGAQGQGLEGPGVFGSAGHNVHVGGRLGTQGHRPPVLDALSGMNY